MLRSPLILILTIALFGLPTPASATGAPAAPEIPVWLRAVLETKAFTHHHPDVRNQQRGLGYYRQHRYEQALTSFRRGAHFADKASQAMLAQMHWRGQGTQTDRALAYAWMDLASERGYPVFLVEREKYWAELSAAEQARAIQVGQDLYAHFGDEVAKPRLERVMRVGLWRSMTGSRTGYDSGARILGLRADGLLDLKSETMSSRRADVYDARYWHPDSYWALQDRIGFGEQTGEVIVHPLRPDNGAGDDD
ncbi:MAG: sel1 repeat family protein [Xanthomonadales bacterium]|nr:sel1 repeat family protein [Xanthomonadales bacterium]